MKKKIFLVSALVAMAMSVMFVSCKDNQTPENGCKCKLYYDGEKLGTEKIHLDDMEDYFDVKTCSKLEKALKEDYDYDSKTSCTSY